MVQPLDAMQYTERFGRYNTARGVLEELAGTPWRRPGQAAAYADQRLQEIRSQDNAGKKQPGPPPRPPQTEAAIIELIETNPLPEQHQGVMKVNELRINGTPVLVPREDFLEIGGLDGDGELIVTVRMFARRIVIGEPIP